MTDDLIRRADALALPHRLSQSLDADDGYYVSVDAIRALPAAQVAVKPLEWVDFAGRGAKAQAWNESSYMIQNWHDGRWEISASYPGYSTSIYGIERFHPTLETAKAAAQADYEARILSAMITTK